MALLREIEILTTRIARTPSGCWEWTGATNGVGYGLVFLNRRRYYAHRFMYAACIGPIPPGLVIDHLCRNTLCCNPEHLEPVTQAENIRRSPLVGLKTQCKHGHPFDAENTYVSPAGARRCRHCSRARWRAMRQRRQA